MEAALTALCATHPEVVAIGPCERCGDHFCSGCQGGTNYCVRCAPRLRVAWEDPEQRALPAFVRTVAAALQHPSDFFARMQPSRSVWPAVGFVCIGSIALVGPAFAIYLWRIDGVLAVPEVVASVVNDILVSPFRVGFWAAVHVAGARIVGIRSAYNLMYRAAAYGFVPVFVALVLQNLGVPLLPPLVPILACACPALMAVFVNRHHGRAGLVGRDQSQPTWGHATIAAAVPLGVSLYFVATRY
jgi:hypothetical protein